MRDSRVAPVEDNLDAFLESIVRSGEFSAGSDTDVWTYWSEVAFPLFNGIGRARFATGSVESRARDVVASFVRRGLPFIWWATPSGHGEELMPVLARLGMACGHVPGMFTELGAPVPDRAPAGVTLREVSVGELVPVMVAGFGIPDGLEPHFHKFLAGLDPGAMVNVVAGVDGEDVACGTLWQTGRTAGLYNIATVERARGRGIGYAVTAALMNAGRARGATHAILHASQQGRPVYERLGFEKVCPTQQFVWTPPDPESADDTPVRTDV
jgi:GNAT superfamily N-acetyltransferase